MYVLTLSLQPTRGSTVHTQGPHIKSVTMEWKVVWNTTKIEPEIQEGEDFG